MTTLLTRLPASHTGIGSASTSTFELLNSASAASDDDVVAPSAGLTPANPFEPGVAQGLTGTTSISPSTVASNTSANSCPSGCSCTVACAIEPGRPLNSNATGLDDDMLTPSASSTAASAEFAAASPTLASASASVVASAATIPGQNGVPPLEVTTAGSGLVFYNTFTKDDTLAYENCVIAAEKQYEGIITSKVTLRMIFDMGVKGDTDYNHFKSDGVEVNYATLKAALHKVAPNDVLPATDPSNGGLYNIAPGYARLLGLTTYAGPDDAIVTFHSNGATWDFGQDVVNAVSHGISEAGLGRVSGMGVVISDDDTVVTPEPDGWEPMDLFRYTASGQ